MLPNMPPNAVVRGTNVAAVATQQQHAYQQQQSYEQVQYEQHAQQQQYHYDQQQQQQQQFAHLQAAYDHAAAAAAAAAVAASTNQDQAPSSSFEDHTPPSPPSQSFENAYGAPNLDAFSLGGTVHHDPKPPAKRKGAFRQEHAIKYGLKVIGPTTAPVSKVQCMFCVHYGREVSADDTKRKMNVKGIKYWTPPFRTDHYAMHHDLQHKVMFQHYENSSSQERLHFFEPDTVHRLRHLVPKVASSSSLDNMDKSKDNKPSTKRGKTSQSRVDPTPTKPTLDPFKMMLPPTEIPHDMQTLVDIYVGHHYTPLEEKWKALTTVASLVAQHVRNGFLETHIRRALLAGASKSEVVQVIMQSASFIGLPKTMDAMKVAHDVFLQGAADSQNQNTVFL
ncbi:hypothetical protein H257_06989 [Aphanomyces astaci]|uniref:Carboxymuconolactone decarboxylase-like domain-containing protein n=3 Tax=Aphanomyces astaci TaxID=112090 RepID=W4GL39_APHAT|nr:hypothetical protein H257_06989 [Aphanomyces astaci]ETV79759.1 hypothetical protein H257_06989 [Aphanomyces astaci]|eukprot:XP_009830695.1 hypothetical protein H257_06989 [Aphanomyces astaci]